MSEFFDDPRYPERPQHLDFARLVGVVNYLDGETSEGGRSFDEVVSQFVDAESLTYMAVQRARRVAAATGIDEAVLATLFIDGFCAGVRFEREGGQRPA